MDSKSGANTEHLCSSLGTFAVLGRARLAVVFVDVKRGKVGCGGVEDGLRIAGPHLEASQLV